jgi:glycosyltransferase involved in cell wall biosynthesis
MLLRDIFRHDPEAQICIVNSASTDEGIPLAKGYRVTICHSEKGYTQALASGYQFAVSQRWKSLIQIDGDGQHNPLYARALHNQLSDADWVIASRDDTGSSGSIFVRCAAWMGNRWLLSNKITDPSSGFWALNERMILRFSSLFPVLFTEIPLRLTELDAGIRIHEVPVPMNVRREGISMNSGLKGGIHGLRMLMFGWKTKKKLQK